MRLTKLFKDFLESERTGGFLLIGCTIISLFIANSAAGEAYLQLWDFHIAGHSITHWINDLLMAIFFLLVGLEIEREIYVGELKEPGKAIFPVIAAIGGMLVPAGLYVMINRNTGDLSGFGIPMATDIAFAIGIISLLGTRIPVSLKIFLTALAIIDDLGAIIIIALFYSKEIDLVYLGAAFAIFIGLIWINRMGVKKVAPYLLAGLVMWFCMLESGIHATLTGVLLAFAIPFRDGRESSPSYKVQHALHKPVAFFILPLFALANTAIFINSETMNGFIQPHSIGIFLGLVVGKPMGIVLLTFIAVKLKWTSLPDSIRWSHVIGAGFLAGIGFTMSIFISLLAFNDPEMIGVSKIAILIASVTAAVAGLIWLRNVPASGQQGVLSK